MMIGRFAPRSRRSLRPRMGAAVNCLLLLLLPLAGLGLPGRASALPLYASREGATCVTCHHDPAGGGMRNEFGFAYARNRHAMDSEDRFAKVTVDPRLNDWITVGLDMRLLYHASTVEGLDGLQTSTFFPMEGQVNLAVMPHDRLTLVASHGVVVQGGGFPADYITRELYALVHGLPHHGYVKVGRFRLPFGLRLDDHTSFVRSPLFLPYDVQRYDAGVEMGAVGPRCLGHASLTNGGGVFAERAQALAAKVGIASQRAQIAASGYHHYSEATGFTNDRWGLYASATRGKVTVLAEAAAGTRRGPSGETNLYAGLAEVDVRASRGINLRAKVDHAEPNRDPGSENDHQWRYVAEADLVPVPFLEMKLSVRRTEAEGLGTTQEYLGMMYVPF